MNHKDILINHLYAKLADALVTAAMQRALALRLAERLADTSDVMTKLAEKKWVRNIGVRPIAGGPFDKPMAAIMGQWPGDETDEQIQEALDELS